MKKNTKHVGKTIDNITKYGIIAVIVLILFAVISFLYIPSISHGVIGKAAHSGFKGTYNGFEKSVLVITDNKDFNELEVGDLIVLKHKFNAEDPNSLESGTYLVKISGVTPSSDPSVISYYSAGLNAMGIPTIKVEKANYRGAYVAHVPGIGMITGFFGSVFGVIFLVVNAGVIGAIVFLFKKQKKQIVE